VAGYVHSNWSSLLAWVCSNKVCMVEHRLDEWDHRTGKRYCTGTTNIWHNC